MAEFHRRNLTERQSAWLVGFIDGEGYLGITFQRKKETRAQAASSLYHPYLIIANTNQPVLSYIRNIVGDGNVYSGKKVTEKTKESFQYKLTRMEVLHDLLESIESYLQIKAPQCRILIEFIKRRRVAQPTTGRGSRGRTSFTAEDENSFRTLLKLNKRGP